MCKLEVVENTKEYSFIEVLQMIKNDSTKAFECYSEKLNICHVISASNDGYIKLNRVEHGKVYRESLNGNINLNSTWKEIDMSVSFMKAVNSKKRVTLSHKEIDSLVVEPQYKYYGTYKKLQTRDFVRIGDVLEALGNLFSDEVISDIITNGKWYIEN